MRRGQAALAAKLGSWVSSVVASDETTRFKHQTLRIATKMPLTDLVKVIPADVAEEDELDIFAFAAGLIFPDDLRNMHGDTGSIIVYKSARFGEIELRVADVVEEDARKRFPQYLWNASLKMSELISCPPDARWDVENQRVLELGAGAVRVMSPHFAQQQSQIYRNSLG